MMTKMEMFTAVSTVIMILIGLGQLAAAIAALDKKTRTERTSWIDKDRVVIAVIAAFALYLIGSFVFTLAPGKWDTYFLACGTLLGALAYSLALMKMVLERVGKTFDEAHADVRGLEQRIELLSGAVLAAQRDHSSGCAHDERPHG